MTPKCEDCKNFHKGRPWEGLDPLWIIGERHKHKCTLTGKSALWERASKLSMPKAPAGNGLHWTTAEPVRDNCGPAGQFFEAKRGSAVA